MILFYAVYYGYRKRNAQGGEPLWQPILPTFWGTAIVKVVVILLRHNFGE